MLADRVRLVFLREAGEAGAIERLVAFHDRLGEGIGTVERVADLGLGVAEPLLCVALDVEGPSPEVKDPWGNIKIGATATTKLDRRDFGLVFNMVLDAGGVMVGDEVAIELELELTRQK